MTLRSTQRRLCHRQSPFEIVTVLEKRPVRDDSGESEVAVLPIGPTSVLCLLKVHIHNATSAYVTLFSIAGS